MTIHYLIDGYNLLLLWHRGPLRRGPGNLERARNALVAWLDRRLPKGDSATVVFDASKTARPKADVSSSGRVRVVFAAGYDSADEWIIEECSRSSGAAVVSNDWQIQAAARRSRVEVVSSHEFLALLSRDAYAEPSATQTCVEATEAADVEKPSVALTPEEIEELRASMPAAQAVDEAPPAGPSRIVPPRHRPKPDADLDDFYRMMRESDDYAED